VAKPDTVLAKMREICRSLPDTKETLTWGEPHFRVGEKIFAGCGDEKGRLTIGFKLEMDHADALVQDPRFHRAPYVGHKGWVSMDAAQIRSWKEVKMLVLESYRLIAPKKTFARFAAGAERKVARKA
jgi:predicted DNA-binding protein (MmcQ/YjbR family)